MSFEIGFAKLTLFFSQSVPTVCHLKQFLKVYIGYRAVVVLSWKSHSEGNYFILDLTTRAHAYLIC